MEQDAKHRKHISPLQMLPAWMNLKKKIKPSIYLHFGKKNQRIFHPPPPPGRLESRLPPPLMDRRECTVQSPSEAAGPGKPNGHGGWSHVSFHQYEKGRVNGCESKLMLILIDAVLGVFLIKRVWFENWSPTKQKAYCECRMGKQTIFSQTGFLLKCGRYAEFLMMARNYFWKADSQLQLLTS